MFTGIIENTMQVIKIIKKNNFQKHILEFKKELLTNLKIGASVSHNGCCLTVTKINKKKVTFDLIKETLKLTNLNNIKEGDFINIERSAKYGDEIGGHILSGHIITTAKIINISKSKYNYQICLILKNLNIMKYISYKGFIAIDGISLTVGDINEKNFFINLIPETILKTTLGKKNIGDVVNVEIDSYTQTIVNTIENLKKIKNNFI
ncbi:riboflavin synthase subunit alpha [Candidatus Providencia siddallii]|uniref:Riboflavin synthase n=1 Tax=Candidatus Providencia siddallii TaxID=1715285 RepID=A0ABM9NPK0_9GAMM